MEYTPDLPTEAFAKYCMLRAKENFVLEDAIYRYFGGYPMSREEFIGFNEKYEFSAKEAEKIYNGVVRESMDYKDCNLRRWS